MTALVQRFRSWLQDPVDGHVIGLFRLAFGLFMVYYAIYYYRIGFIPEGLVRSKILFRFEHLEWIPLFPEPVMYGILATMGVAGALIAAGVLFRWACWIFSLCLAYFFFQEVSYYNNHIYLFILLPLLLSATDADRFLSLRSKGRSFNRVPRWQQFVLQFQIVIVYFFAGIVKFKADWLVRKEPMTWMIRNLPDTHWMAPLIKHDFNIDLFTYGGFALDLLSPLLLWYRPVRNWAWIPFVLFHLTNSQIFDDISIFPFVMLAAMVLFFYTEEIALLRRLAPRSVSGKGQKGKSKPAEEKLVLPRTSRIAERVLVGYFVFHLLFPLRGMFLPNPLDYTTIGNRFSWRVKADTRLPEEISFTMQHPVSGEQIEVDVNSFLNPMQMRTIITDPRTTRQFAWFLQAEAARQGVEGVQVRARIRFRYNQRPVQFFVDPDVDLTTVPYSPFRRLDWVIPPVE
ncbi:MAG: hypothetical protein EP344_07635 [Bacteroidetes bacterium]|nr:MAG: hypothetical protein EP344_07635 [Bacteroidota bacterium]